MNEKKILVIASILLITISLSACNLPFRSTPTPFLQPTTDPTTDVLYELLATSTAQAQTTHVPTEVPVQPTATTAATETSPPAASEATATSAAPTATKAPNDAPTQAATNPPSSSSVTRNKPYLKAYYLKAEPVIDGDLGEWEIPEYPVQDVVFGDENWSGKSDLSAEVRIGWDDYNFYIAAEVIDDVYVQNSGSRLLYLGDDIEVQLDKSLAADYYVQTLSADDFQLGVSPGSPDPGTALESYLWYPRNVRGVYPTVEMAAVETANGYTIEVKMPWKIFNMTPVKNAHYGFAFSVSDNDDPDEIVQQSMVSTNPYRMLTDPTTWNDLELLGQYKP